jgi:hypothetical protein
MSALNEVISVLYNMEAKREIPDTVNGNAVRVLLGKAGNELSATYAELASLREERDDYKSKWEYVEGLNKAVVAQNDSVKEERDALRLVAGAARTGQGLDDALDALDALKGEK